jgi:YVTN family beta-propeller protein
MFLRSVKRSWIFLFAVLGTTAAQAQNPLSTYTNFEGAQTSPVRISTDGTRLYAVNTGAARVSIFDLSSPAAPQRIAEIPVGIEPVSVNPRTNDEIWVVNQESDSVSVVSVSKGIVTDTIYLPDEPADVVFAGTAGNAFVTLARNNSVAVVSASTHRILQTLALTGGNPRALAVSPDGSMVYAVFAVSGNQTTLIPANLAPPQPPPTNPALPPPPQVGKIVSINNTTYARYLNFTMPDNDVAIIDANQQTVTGYYQHAGTLNFGIAVRPGSGDLYVTNTDARNLIDFETNLKGHWVDNRVTRIQVSNGNVQVFDLNRGIDYGILPNPQALATALAQPTAAVFDPSGRDLWVAAYGTDRVAKLDANGTVLNRVEVGPSTGSTANPTTKRGPRGLAMNPSGNHLYVLNRISNTITVINTRDNTLAPEIGVGYYDPTPVEIKNGRGFLYDAKLSGNGTGACASCHIDGDMDHLAWDLGDPTGSMTTVVSNGQTFQEHPMKGPMTTQTLRGLVNLAPYHWRGDKPDFAAFNAAFQALMGGTQLSSADMTTYTNYINTLTFMPNPLQNLDRTYPTRLRGGNAANGENLFITLFTGSSANPKCVGCHTAKPPGTNTFVVVLGSTSSPTQPLKNPQLRNIYQKLLMDNNTGAESIDGFGLDHDGRFATFPEFFQHSFPLVFSNSTNTADLIAFLMAFDTGTAPAVGLTITVTSSNLTASATTVALNLLASQAQAGNCDLIAKGTVNKALHGLLYNPSTGTFQMDVSGSAPLTPSQLTANISKGDILTFMGVPKGSGQWMGIDFDLDGVLDGDPGGNR